MDSHVENRSQPITGARFRPTRVLLLAQDPVTRRLATDCLSQGAGFCVYEQAQGLLEPWPVDVAVIDGSSTFSPGQLVDAGLLRPDVRIVAIGTVAGGHVRLPAECTSRELTLACELAGRISRLCRRLERQRQTMRRLRRWALSDLLTGLNNRRAWDVELKRRCQLERPANRPFALLLVDVDRFKAINDQYGLAVGDDVLRRLAGVLAEQTGSPDYAARLGGDEFGLLLSDLDAAEAWERAERLRSELGRQAGGPVQDFSVSGGLAVCSADRSTADALYRGASDALREAKLAGRNRTCVTRVD